MEEILFLAHRIPYPPDKGDKIRSWNLLRWLCGRYRVHLGCFVDDAHDLQHIARLQELCGETRFIHIDPRIRRIRSLAGLATGQPLTLSYFRSPRLARWIDDTLVRRRVSAVIAFSSSMAQYVVRGLAARLPRIVDFVDVDSEKWRAYSARASWPGKLLYAREARRLLEFERLAARRCEWSTFVSEAEAALFRRLAPEAGDKVLAIGNGVDCDFYSPGRSYDDPIGRGGPAIVFTGAMDYSANVDAMTWFVDTIFPRIRTRVQDARCFIVGARPTANIRALGLRQGVVVTGRVADVRPYLAHASAVVAPMRIARGIQNKVLEAMAMAKPVIATPEAAEGITAAPGTEILIAAGEQDFAEATISALTTCRRATVGAAARARVVDGYDWSQMLAAYEPLLSSTGRRTA